MAGRYGLSFASTAATASVAVLLLVAPGSWALDDGETAPDFTAPMLQQGKSVSLKSFRGKVVYLDFWASWCPPCLSSIPQLGELAHEFDSKDFQLLAVNVDEDPDAARKFLRKHPVDYPHAMDPHGRVPEKFGLETMPTSYLIDADGVIRYVHEGFRRGDIERIRHEIKKLIGGAQ